MVLAALMVFLTGAAHAERFKVNLWGGTVGASSTGLDRTVTQSGTPVAQYTVKGASFDSLSRSALYGLDAGYEFYPGLVIGARISRLSSAQDISSNGIAFNPFTGATGSYTIGFDMGMTPLLVGGTLTLPITERFSFAGQLYLGYALTEARFNVRESAPGLLGNVFTGSTSDFSFSGSGTASDVSGEFRYAVSSRVSLGAGLHFISAKASDLAGPSTGPGGLRSSALSLNYNNISFSLGLAISL